LTAFGCEKKAEGKKGQIKHAEFECARKGERKKAECKKAESKRPLFWIREKAEFFLMIHSIFYIFGLLKR
jgi:hypothetical protein